MKNHLEAFPPAADSSLLNRRSFLRAGAFTGAALTLRPAALLSQAAAPVDRVAQMRQSADNVPIKVTPLRDNLFLLQGAGGNMVAQTGPDGQLLIDTSFSPAVPRIREALATLSKDPLTILVNTHWHFDHTDGNEGLHAPGVSILAHANTRERLATPQVIRLLDLHFPASPAKALPTQTFDREFAVYQDGDQINLAHFDPAHTDTDIYIHFTKGDLLHVGDIWFNGFYPLIDDSSGGRINGMVAACERSLALAGPQTKIVPGHGPLGDKASLQSYRDMLATVRDRVSKLKSSGSSLEEAVAKKPTADLDSTWGHGSMTPEVFTAQVYRTL
jgi:glyoxylase-like metal-dependent hydrolase (beta-lactamase superfamily II)